MTHSESLPERRTRRSEDRAEALELCLEACRARGNFEVVVVADDAGLLVGASRSRGASAAELAASLPARARRPAGLASALFKVSGRPLFVAALGGGSDAFRRLSDAMHGARRILGAPLDA